MHCHNVIMFVGEEPKQKLGVGDEGIVKTATEQLVWRITKIEYQK